MTSNITEIEIIEHLDFDIEEACQTAVRDCDNKAEWIAIRPCCGSERLLCDYCRRQAAQRYVDNANVPKVCVTCGTAGVDLPTSKFFPLRG
jgi:hypothetical protein